MSDQPEKIDHGYCLCGAVKFTVVGEPIYNVVCHCENCRRQGGGSFATASIFLKKQYSLDAGEEKITTYEDKDVQSHQVLYRRFCSVCGSKLGALTPLNNDIISIPAGALQTAGGDWKPSTEQFCRDKIDWVPEFGDVMKRKFKLGPSSSNVEEITK